MKKTVYFIVLTAIVQILSACSGSTVYDDYAHTPIAGWEKNDTLSFARYLLVSVINRLFNDERKSHERIGTCNAKA